MGQLRSFSAYTKNANAGVNLVANPCTLVNIDGNYIAGAAGQYFQIHDKATAPVNTDVPLRSFYLPSAGPVNLPSIYQVLGPLNLTLGLSVAISSSEATLTLGVGTFDVFGDTEEWEQQITGLTTSTTQTGAAALDFIIWSDASGPQYLYELTFTNNEGVTVYPMLFTQTTTPSTGTRPNYRLTPLTTGTTRKFKFGLGGLSPLDHTSNLVSRKGCHFIVSDTAGTYGSDTLTSNASTTAIAKYKVSGQTP